MSLYLCAIPQPHHNHEITLGDDVYPLLQYTPAQIWPNKDSFDHQIHIDDLNALVIIKLLKFNLLLT